MRKGRLTFEALEPRVTPAQFGVPWPEPDSLSLSFVPDGTIAGGPTSSLFRILDAQLPRQVWQTAILRAFQTWAVQTDINIGVVPDGGQPLGTLGLKQKDPRFGDIRIGAVPLGNNELAVADPYDPFVANTWVGDVLLNSNALFNIGGTGGPGGAYDLFSVMLHEAGHVLGLGHSTDPASPMFEDFQQVRTGLTPGDVANLRHVYWGMHRPPDSFEGATGDDTFATAAPLRLASDQGQPVNAEIQGDITTLQDQDIYRVTVPTAGGFDVRLQVAGISALVAHLEVFDQTGRLLASTAASDPLHNDLALHLDNVQPGQTLFVRVRGATGDVFSIGSYQLVLHPTGAVGADVGHTNPPAITPLSTTQWYVEHTYYEADGVLTPIQPVQSYLVRSVDLGPGLTNVMTVVVSSPFGDAASYAVTVRDAQGNVLTGVTYYKAAGQLALRFASVKSNVDYLVEVRAGAGTPPNADVPYVVEVDFAQDASHLVSLVRDDLSSQQTAVTHPFQVTEGQQYHFVLSATDNNMPQETGVRLQIYDASGRLVFTLAAPDGASRTGDVYLAAGNYTLRFTRAAGPQSHTPVHFELSETGLSEPIGPQLRDTTRDPVEVPAAAPTLSFYYLPLGSSNLPPLAAAALANTAAGFDPAGFATGEATAAVGNATVGLTGAPVRPAVWAPGADAVFALAALETEASEPSAGTVPAPAVAQLIPPVSIALPDADAASLAPAALCAEQPATPVAQAPPRPAVVNPARRGLGLLTLVGLAGIIWSRALLPSVRSSRSPALRRTESDEDLATLRTETD